MKPPITWNLLEACRRPAEECLARTNWHELCLRASRHNDQECVVLEQVATGLNHVVRLLEFQDCTRWVVRIPIAHVEKEHPARSFGLRAEVDILSLLGEKTSIVPRIFDYELTAENPVGVPFILMEFLPGDTAMDSLGGWESHLGAIPHTYRYGFYSSVAKMQVELASVRFSKIGIVTRDAQGNYDVGPFPRIGGPFETAQSFFTAWARYAEFPARSFELLARMAEQGQENLAREVSDSIARFPSRLIQIISKQTTLKPGPFPVCHNDLMHSNIIVDKNLKALGIIDWEGACTLPWELVEYPLFLDTLPRAFSAPDKYNDEGVPLDPETKECWLDRERYLDMVQKADSNDHQLSRSLGSAKDLALAYVMRAFQAGKLGFYDRVLDQYLEQTLLYSGEDGWS